MTSYDLVVALLQGPLSVPAFLGGVLHWVFPPMVVLNVTCFSDFPSSCCSATGSPVAGCGSVALRRNLLRLCVATGCAAAQPPAILSLLVALRLHLLRLRSFQGHSYAPSLFRIECSRLLVSTPFLGGRFHPSFFLPVVATAGSWAGLMCLPGFRWWEQRSSAITSSPPELLFPSARCSLRSASYEPSKVLPSCGATHGLCLRSCGSCP